MRSHRHWRWSGGAIATGAGRAGGKGPPPPPSHSKIVSGGRRAAPPAGVQVGTHFSLADDRTYILAVFAATASSPKTREFWGRLRKSHAVFCFVFAVCWTQTGRSAGFLPPPPTPSGSSPLSRFFSLIFGKPHYAQRFSPFLARARIFFGSYGIVFVPKIEFGLAWASFPGSWGQHVLLIVCLPGALWENTRFRFFCISHHFHFHFIPGK